MPEQHKRNPNTFCALCKKPIYRRPVEIQKGQVFCSNACYGISQRQEVPCVVCGKLILKGLNKKTCSRTCANTNRAGIIYKTGRRNDKVKSQKRLKIRLLESRGIKCEKCDYNKYEILQIHHIDRNRTNNSLNNLLLICPNCHYEEHLLEKSWLRKNLRKS